MKKYVTAGSVITNRIIFTDKRVMDRIMGGHGLYAHEGVCFGAENAVFISAVGKDFDEYYGRWFDQNSMTREGLKFCLDRCNYNELVYFPDGQYKEYSIYGPEEEVKNRELRGESRGEEPVEDGVLSDWLLRARRVVLGKRRNSPEEMAKRIALERENEKVETGKEESDVDRVNEFCKRFKSVMAEQEREKQIRETEKQTRETEKPQEKEPNDPQTQQTETIGETVETEETPTETESNPASSNQPMASELQKSEENSESESESEEMGDFFEQPRLGRGLGDALKYLRAQKVEDVEEEAYGRRNDTMIRSSNEESRDGVL